MYYFNYPFADEEGAITIATTRPKRCLRMFVLWLIQPMKDTKKHIGKKVINPLMEALIPIIADFTSML